jgi:hypothetical protein
MATREKEQAAVEKQLTVDAIMSDAFRERAGSEDTTSRAALYGYPSTQVHGILYFDCIILCHAETDLVWVIHPNLSAVSAFPRF